MKATMKFFSIATLALVAAVMAGCSSDDDVINEPQQPEKTSNVVTLTTTVGLGEGEGTRALGPTGVKTFAEGETMALVYKNTDDATIVVESEALTTADIAEGAHSATFTFTLADPDKTQDVTYIYPAAMAKADGSVNYEALATQDGTLTSLGSNLDLATYTGAWDGEKLPGEKLENQLAILAIKLKNDAATPVEINSGITSMTIGDGTNTYTVTRTADADCIYVAIQPTSAADLTITATDGSGTDYTKSLTGKTYEASNGYSVSWKMAEVITYTAPTLRTGSDTYNGSAKALLATDGSATNGTLSYSYRYKTHGGSYGNWSGWSTTAPTGTNAGVYEVKYKVEPAEGYGGGIGETSLGEFTINKANGYVQLDPNSSNGWFSSGSKNAYANINHHGGSLSVSKSGGYPSNLNANVSGNTLVLSKVSPLFPATCIVTVTSAATTNYNAASATYYCNS